MIDIKSRENSSGVLVDHVFEAQAAETPDAVALIGTEGSFTYGQLSERAGLIASLLWHQGVRPGDFVAIALDRCFDVPATFLAILKCGAAYCPLDLKYPTERIQLILADAKVAVIVSHIEPATRLPQTNIPVLLLDKPGVVDSAEQMSLGLAHPDGVVCVLYTSGSTGVPKGVLVPHRGIIRLIFGSDYVPFGPEMRMLLHSQLAFDASTLELWGPLLHGGTVVLLAGRGVPTLHEFRRAIQEYSLTTLFLGPSVFNLIVEEDLKLLTGLQHVLVGGEAMSPTHARRALAQFPRLWLVNGYGPTETTTFATTYVVPVDFPASAMTVPIGRAIARTTLYVVDDKGGLAENGGVGELYIGGDGVAKGYLNRPELTAERFVPDRFGPDPEAHLYRTGDLCRWLPDGNLDYVGRIDHQVKIRGHRIEPGEIEVVMQHHPAVAQGIVVTGGGSADRFLIGYFTVRRGHNCSPDDLRAHLKRQLPDYLVPEWLVSLEQIPINANGKVDRAALPDPKNSIVVRSEQQPRNKIEIDLMEIWKNVLGIPQLGINDCFFAMGGTSIGMMKLCTLIERRMHRFISVGNFISATTVAQMALFLQSNDTESELHLAIQLKSGDGTAPIMCLPGLGGHPLTFLDMAKKLQYPGSVYGLQFPHQNHAGAPANTVEEIADICVEEIARIAPPQSVHLVGYSFGGLVIFEIARQLQLRRLHVRSVILLDAFLPRAMQPRNFFARLWVHGKRICRYGLGTKAHRMLEKDAAFASAMPSDTHSALRPHGLEIDRNVRQAFNNYQPTEYKGDIIMIQPSEIPEWLEFCVVDPSGGWSGVVQGTIHKKKAPGNHLSMLGDLHVDDLARIIDECIETSVAVEV